MRLAARGNVVECHRETPPDEARDLPAPRRGDDSCRGLVVVDYYHQRSAVVEELAKRSWLLSLARARGPVGHQPIYAGGHPIHDFGPGEDADQTNRKRRIAS